MRTPYWARQSRSGALGGCGVPCGSSQSSSGGWRRRERVSSSCGSRRSWAIAGRRGSDRTGGSANGSRRRGGTLSLACCAARSWFGARRRVRWRVTMGGGRERRCWEQRRWRWPCSPWSPWRGRGSCAGRNCSGSGGGGSGGDLGSYAGQAWGGESVAATWSPSGRVEWTEAEAWPAGLGGRWRAGQEQSIGAVHDGRNGVGRAQNGNVEAGDAGRRGAGREGDVSGPDRPCAMIE